MKGSAAQITVLLADDDAAYLELLRALVEHQPELQVIAQATNGLQAIELTDALRPDAAVLDIHMPLVDGVTACARLRHDHPSLCLIAITSDREPELHRAVTEAGADAVLLKDELMDTLVERLSQARASS